MYIIENKQEKCLWSLDIIFTIYNSLHFQENAEENLVTNLLKLYAITILEISRKIISTISDLIIIRRIDEDKSTNVYHLHENVDR